MSGPVLVFFHRGEYEALHQGLSIAAAAVAAGRKVELYFFWWALERLVAGQLDEPDLDREDVNDHLERRGVPLASELLSHVRASGLATLFACTGSLAALGLNPSQVESRVDQLVGWSTILQRTAGVTDRFSL